MYVKAIIILCMVVIVLLMFLFGRGRTNGSGIQDNRDGVDKLRNGTTAAKDINSKLRTTAENRQSTAGEIKRNNTAARSGVRKALDILTAAEHRDNT